MQECWFGRVALPATSLCGGLSGHRSPGCRRENWPPSWAARVALGRLVLGKLHLSAAGTLSVTPARAGTLCLSLQLWVLEMPCWPVSLLGWQWLGQSPALKG